VRDLKDQMENQSDTSQLQRNVKARNYRRRARKTYKLIQVNLTIMTLVYPDLLAHLRQLLIELSTISSGIRWLMLHQ
jgi:hypothetical protein